MAVETVLKDQGKTVRTDITMGFMDVCQDVLLGSCQDSIAVVVTTVLLIFVVEFVETTLQLYMSLVMTLILKPTMDVRLFAEYNQGIIA